jgi:hypothetical protein
MRLMFVLCACVVLVNIATAQADKPIRLSVADAKRELRAALEDSKLGDFVVLSDVVTIDHCQRRSRTRVRCNRVNFEFAGEAFEGWATAQLRESGLVHPSWELVETCDASIGECRRTYRHH